MLGGYTDDCDRPRLRQMQKDGYFENPNVMNRPPSHISLIQGTMVQMVNMSKKTTKDELMAALIRHGPVKQCDVKPQEQKAIVSMVHREDALDVIETFNGQHFLGSQLEVSELKPSRKIKLMKQAKYNWKNAMPDQYDRSIDAKIEDLEHIVVQRGFFPKDFPSPHRVKFTVRVSFKEY